MAEQIKMSDIRAKFPMYADMSDENLLLGLRKKFYADIPLKQFVNRIEFDTLAEKMDPTSGMDEGEKFRAGVGKAFTDLARGAGQMFGAVSHDDVAESRKRDAPLMRQGAGMAGNLFGNVSALAPTALVPGAATIPGAAVIGGVTGALAPSASTEETIKNTALGGALGPAAIVGGRLVGATVQGGRALIEPFTHAGQQRIAGRTLQQFGISPADAIGLSNAPTVTGARTTLAEQLQNPQSAAAAARLQGAIRSADPQTAAQISAREVENNAARVNTLRNMAGTDGARDFAVANRAGTTGPMYRQAFGVDAASAMTPEMQREMQTLLRSPAIQQAARAARANAANSGANVGPANASGSIEGLHNIKLALDDAIAQARGGGGTPAQEVRARGIEDARRRLVGFIERLSPEYANARGVYAQMSRPVNQMDVADEVLRRGSANSGDLAGNPRLMPNALLGAMRDEPALIRRATGRNLGGGLDDLMEPDQLRTLRGLQTELDRSAAVGRAENGPGSATAQRLASQNLLRQLLGPTGMPQSWAESTMLHGLLSPYTGVVRLAGAEREVMDQLTRAVLEPEQAAVLLQLAQQRRAAQLGLAAQPLLPALPLGGLLSNSPQ
jgi:hypothetical protein